MERKEGTDIPDFEIAPLLGPPEMVRFCMASENFVRHRLVIL